MKPVPAPFTTSDQGSVFTSLEPTWGIKSVKGLLSVLTGKDLEINQQELGFT